MDNVSVDGREIAADDVGGVYFQKFKLDLGGDGASVPVTVSVPVSVTEDPAQGEDGATPPSKVVAIGGTDGTNLQLVKTDVDGVLQVAITGTPQVVADPTSIFYIETNDTNSDLSILTSTARTVAEGPTPQTTDHHKGIRLFLSVAAAPNDTAETLGLQIEQIDPVTGAAHAITAFTATPAANTATFTNLGVPGLNAPIGSTTSGTLAAGTYYYKVVAVNAQGQTTGSNEVSVTTTGTTSSVNLTWSAVSEATGYRVYRGTATGAQNVYYVATSAALTDTGAASTAGGISINNTADIPTSFIYELYPSISTAGLPTRYQAQSNTLPRLWQVRMAHSGSSPWTYGLGAALIR